MPIVCKSCRTFKRPTDILLLSQLTFVLYTVDSFPHLSASVGAANALLRLLFAMAFPLITPKLYNNLSTEWAGSVLGIFSIF